MRMNFNLKKGASVLMLSAAVCAANAQIVSHVNSLTMDDLKKVNKNIVKLSDLRMNQLNPVAVQMPESMHNYVKAQKAAELRYVLPEGVYNVSPTGLWQSGSMPENGYFIPLLADVTFKNRSTDYTSFNWIYNDGFEELNSTEKDLTFTVFQPFQTDFVESVTLESDGKQFYHGENMYTGIQTIATALNTMSPRLVYYTDQDESLSYGWNPKKEISMMGATFSKPATPMALTDVLIPIRIEGSDPLNGKVGIRGIDAEGQYVDWIVEPQDVKTDANGNMILDLTKKPVAITTAFAIMFYPEPHADQPKNWSFLNADISNFSDQQLRDDVRFIFQQKKDPGNIEGWTEDAVLMSPANPAIFFGMISPCLYPLLPDQTGQLAPIPTKELMLNGLDAVETPFFVLSLGIKLTDVKAGDASITVSDFKCEDEKQNIYSCNLKLTAADKERTSTIEFTTEFGTTWTFSLKQYDPASIGSVEQEGSVVAAFNGAAFEVSYPEGVNAVQVVNVAGQTVAEYSLEGTSATIPAAALANGMYVLKFDNGTSVKVMR